VTGSSTSDDTPDAPGRGDPGDPDGDDPDEAELRRQYDDYLERIAQRVGKLEVGAFAKHSGHLIKKLSFDDFARAYIGYSDLVAHYRESLARGDTINDILLKLLREQAASLVLTAPE
jgi:hypothetical protein